MTNSRVLPHSLLRRMLASLLLLASAEFLVNAATITTATPDGKRWEVAYNGKTLCVYNFAPDARKPYVQELHTLRGENLLRDNVPDHPHHHGLMYAIIVNGVDFWAETPGSGIERAVGGVTSSSRSENGRTEATFKHRLHWIAEADRDVASSEASAFLIEDRQLTLFVDEASGEVALRWTSEFQPGGRTNAVELTGRDYLGLGMRFLKELDPVAAHNLGGKTPDLGGTRQEVAKAAWGAVTFDTPGRPATIAVFGAPANLRGEPYFFTMARPFAYLSATQRLDQEPLRYKQGDRWTLDYLVAVYADQRDTQFLNRRESKWKQQLNVPAK